MQNAKDILKRMDVFLRAFRDNLLLRDTGTAGTISHITFLIKIFLIYFKNILPSIALFVRSVNNVISLGSLLVSPFKGTLNLLSLESAFHKQYKMEKILKMDVFCGPFVATYFCEILTRILTLRTKYHLSHFLSILLAYFKNIRPSIALFLRTVNIVISLCQGMSCVRFAINDKIALHKSYEIETLDALLLCVMHLRVKSLITALC